MKKTYLILCYMIAAHFTFSQTTLTLRPNSMNGQDAWLDSGNPTTNYGSYPTAAAISWTRQGAPFDSRSLINFNLNGLPTNAIITNAKLSLFCNTTSDHTQLHSGLNSCYLQRITSSWDENLVTWNTQPTSTTINQVSLAASTSTTQNYLDIDVTNLINDIRNNPTTSFGLMLKLQTEEIYRSLIFASSDHADSLKWPELVITYKLDVGLNKISNSFNFQIFPNPANDFIKIVNVNSSLKGATVVIFDALGKQVYSEKITANKYETEINLSGLNNGNYLMLINSNSGNESYKFLKN